ncbi:DUF4157 domain-containing protein [Leptobacterium flavescens]|uniref:DUF4157 domain-containing protein n=1 Tax=Leptobacterium flavescens TaxID=472055 RepID=A0A6P0UP00_9FLAO|nr:DUF4157 domain-containing protein [Leptobacterium flavescens]NER12066.1 DUF4157 domain-containing protein [Leptobacterium flavescens]
MKTAELKIASTANHHVQMKQQPFFGKGGEGSFFSENKEPASSFFNNNHVQTKLNIGQPDDKYEVEADAMADKVVQRLSTENEVSNTPILNTVNAIQAKCSTCEEEEKLQRKEEELMENDLDIERKLSSDSSPEPPDDDENIQAKSNGVGNANTSSLESRLQASKGKGSPMSQDTQDSMGSAFGTDFSNVRIHTGSNAVQMSRELNAQAFTYGNDIYFNQGKYDTKSIRGKHLLAHELTHTIQQNHNMVNKQELTNQTMETSPLNPEYDEVIIPDGTEIGDTPCPDLIPDYPTEPDIGRTRNSDENLYERILNFGGDFIDNFAILREIFPNYTDLWQSLPLSVKVSIIDRSIDNFINDVISRNRLPENLQLIENIVRPGIISFANRMREMPAELKVRVFERAITLIVNPNYYLGVLKGLIVGFFIDGLVGIIQMIIDLICLIPKIKNFFQAIGRFLGLIPEEMQTLLRSISELETELQEAAENAGQEFNEIINDPRRMSGIMLALSLASVRISSQIGERVADFYIRSYRLPAFSLGEIVGRVIGQLIFEVITLVFSLGGGAAITTVKSILRIAGKLLKKIGQFIFPLFRVLRVIFRHAMGIISGIMRFLTSGFRRVAVKLRLVLGDLDEIFRLFNVLCRVGSIRCLRRRLHRSFVLRGVTLRGFRNAGEVMERVGNLRNRLLRMGITDMQIGIRGSSITGVSHSRGTPFRWLPGGGLGPSDVDIFITSPTLERRIRFLHGPGGDPFPGGRISRRRLRALLPDIAEELERFSEQTASQLGRNSSVIILEEAFADSLPTSSRIIF